MNTYIPSPAGLPCRPPGALLVALLCTTIGFVMLSGCASTKAVKAGEHKATEEEIRRFESTFQPSDSDPARVLNVDRHPRHVDTSSVIVADEFMVPASQETTQGFRVQVFSTTSIDAARDKKSEFEAVFPEEWFYLHYHAPTYKLRAGNFQNRFEADRFARRMTELGYVEAWTVPEKVLISPGKRP